MPAEPGDLPPEIGSTLSADDRATARRCLTALGVLGAGSLVGVAASFYLLNHSPVLLILLSPIGRHLILVAPTLHPATFVAAAVSRRLLFYLFSYRLGRALGPFGIVWLEMRAARAARFMRWLERLFNRAPRTVVSLMPGPGVSTLAGTAKMPEREFVPLITLGLILRMLLIVGFAEWLRAPIESILAWVDENWIPGTVVLVTGVGLYQWWRVSRSRTASGDL